MSGSSKTHDPRFEKHEYTMKCINCGKIYRQLVIKRLNGHGSISQDICPYCKAINERSTEEQYTNFKLDHGKDGK